MIHGRVAKSPPIRMLRPQEANQMLNSWHYLGEVRGVIVALGHSEGCCVFTNPRSRLLDSHFAASQVIELARMVGMPNHQWAMTSLMAQSLQYIKRMGYTTVITYADPWNSNTGMVYRAGNWQPDGTTQSDTVYLLDGKRISRRTFYDRHGTQSRTAMKAIYGDRLQFEVAPPKQRFVMHLK